MSNKTKAWDKLRQIQINSITPKRESAMMPRVLELRREKLMNECRLVSDDFTKCELCEFRFKCWTMKPTDGSIIRAQELSTEEMQELTKTAQRVQSDVLSQNIFHLKDELKRRG